MIRPQSWNGMLAARGCVGIVAILLLAATPSVAFDGAGSGGGDGGEPPPEGASAPPPTYYESILGGAPLQTYETSEGGLPNSLFVNEASGAAWYQLSSEEPDALVWRVDVEVDARPHERVEAVYDVVVALPLPLAAKAGTAIGPREGSAGKSVALVYGGEKVLLKRNVALERSWLPLLNGASGGLPDLGGTGYAFSLWDAIVGLDSSQGDTLQARGSLEYRSDLGVGAPDPGDSRFGVYVINWIPTLDPGIAPYTLRIDVTPAP